MEQGLDLTIRHGRIVTGDAIIEGDVGVRDGRIVAIEPGLPPGARDIDAAGRWVLPGGIDSHCHVEQLSGMGVMGADDFYSATVSAAFGGTTTIIPFAAQHRGMAVPDVVRDYAERARTKAVIDYGFHLILANPDDRTMMRDLPEAIRNGISSLKVYMTYDSMKLDDYQLLDVFDLAREHGALVMVHAENNDMIKWLARRLIERGHTAPKFHAVAHDPLAEAEATNRAITLSRLVGTPILIVHVAGGSTVEVIRSAQTLGARVLAESCPQYLFLTAEDLDRAGLEGAKYCCSPPPRDAGSQEAIWQGFADGTLLTYSSDHAPYRFDETGKLPKGERTTFKEMANGVPGLELRMPLLFSEGVLKGRISIHQFVELTAANHADLYGLSRRKGRVAIGTDADLALWNPDREVRIAYDDLHDRVGYTPYEGKVIKGWPEVVVSRGRVVVENGRLHAERGSGQYLRREAPIFAWPPRCSGASRPRAGLLSEALAGAKSG
ncbi:Dihydropyrimidinase OS=Castellaniella sp OX=1955812 GN=hydA PE=3 SV=1 [Castellaniella denitrificans]|uniref:dihydropyrimidinase n=1 Tax=Castellaniella sp. TaxID=1955812 RepID=UPI002AFFDDFF|nr:dihydropyrimidinase [Castellaniella sp.]